MVFCDWLKFRMNEPGQFGSDMEVRMMWFTSRRAIVIATCFVVWIGAAGLICRALVPSRLGAEEGQSKIVDPSQVVRAEPPGEVATPIRVTLAER